MIDQHTTENFHNTLIDEFGGSKGLRDEVSLLAALARPYATYDQNELYPTPIEKAAAVFESMHPFIDGNKRIAYVLMRLTLLEFGLDIAATLDEKYELTIAASKGELRFEEIKQWINEKITNDNQ